MWYLPLFSMTGPIFAFARKTVQSLHNPNNTKSLKMYYFEIWYSKYRKFFVFICRLLVVYHVCLPVAHPEERKLVSNIARPGLIFQRRACPTSIRMCKCKWMYAIVLRSLTWQKKC